MFDHSVGGIECIHQSLLSRLGFSARLVINPPLVPSQIMVMYNEVLYQCWEHFPKNSQNQQYM